MTESIEIKPLERATGTVSAPPSKSYSNRAYTVAALAEGTTRLVRPLFSDDTRYMKQALAAFGVSVEETETSAMVHGCGGQLATPPEELFVGNAGTTMRFLTTFANLAGGEVRITGNERMQERPIQDLLDALHEMGVDARSAKGNGCPPVILKGGGVPGGTLHLAGDKSSQYLTSLLLSAPYFQSDTTIKILGELTSKPYVDITLDIMQAFGVTVENESYQEFRVPAGQRYQARDYTIEGDASSASYFFAAAAVTGGEVTVDHLNPESAQGDIRFPRVLEMMGCAVHYGDGKITLSGNRLRGIDVSMNSMPDVAQTLAVVALFAEGPTTITGIANLRIKETDRIGALASELEKLGATVETGEDFLKVIPGPLRPAAIETFDDHRMAMSFAIAGLRIPGIRILNPACVNKSFPEYFERLGDLYS